MDKSGGNQKAKQWEINSCSCWLMGKSGGVQIVCRWQMWMWDLEFKTWDPRNPPQPAAKRARFLDMKVWQ